MTAPEPPRCVFCGFGSLGAVREPIEHGTPVVCGGCGGLMVVDVVDVDDVPMARLRKPASLEGAELHRDPDVRRFLDAFAIETVERAAEGVRKSKVKGKVRLRSGDAPTELPPMTAHGPDWRP